MPSTKDKRGKLLNHSDIQKWFDSPSQLYRIGLKNEGEFRMGCDCGRFCIELPNGDEWINFGDYRFALADPDKPFVISSDDEYLILDWLFWHIHGAMSPVMIHLPSRTYTIIESRRILFATGISRSVEGIMAICTETVWTNSKREDVPNVEIKVNGVLKPIQDFYELDPFTIDTLVFQWNEGQLKTIPLKEHPKSKR